MSDKREFGAGPGNTIGRDHEDVGGIGSTPGAIPDERAGGEPDGGAGTQGGAPGDLARATGTGESGLGGGEGDAGGGGGAGGDMAPFDDAGRSV